MAVVFTWGISWCATAVDLSTTSLWQTYSCKNWCAQRKSVVEAVICELLAPVMESALHVPRAALQMLSMD